MRGQRGAWGAAAVLTLVTSGYAGRAGAEEASRCSAWKAFSKPNERIELRICESLHSKDAASGDAEEASAEDEGDADAEGQSAAAVAYGFELRSGYDDERKVRVELGSAGNAVEAIETSVKKGVTSAGLCQKCSALSDIEKWRVAEASVIAPSTEVVRPVAANNHMDVLARDLRLSDRNAERLQRIAASYFQATHKRLVVTGGTRPPQRQAQLMYDKLKRDEDVVKLYENKPAAIEIRAAYRDGAEKHLSRKALVLVLKEAIEAQMARGVFVSKHLRSGAVDVRSWDMTEAMEKALREALKEAGVTLMDERGSAEPHFHLSF